MSYPDPTYADALAELQGEIPVTTIPVDAPKRSVSYEWLLLGVVSGLLIAALVYVAFWRPAEPPKAATKTAEGQGDAEPPNPPPDSRD
jgi:hypothetical protein